MSAVNSTSISPSSSPASMSNAPKFGTRVPNRVFVGGISSNTSESELFDHFSTFGCVKETKIIADRAGVSKGYGFVTFSCEAEAENILKEESIVLKDRKLNVAPAIRKQPFGRIYGSPDNRSERGGGGSISGQSPRATPDWSLTSPEPAPISSSGTVFYHNGPYSYPSSGVIYAATDGTCQFSQPTQLNEAAAYYPIIYSPTLYIPQQQYQYQTAAAAQAQWTNQQIRWAAHVGYGQSPNPQASATTASTPQYIYASNGVSGTPLAASIAPNTSVNQISTIGHSPSQGGGDSCSLPPNNGPPTVTYAYAYPPPPLPHSTYQHPPPPLIGAQADFVEPSMVEVQQTESPPPVSQDSTGPTDSRGIHIGRRAAGRFMRGAHHQGPVSDDYRFMRPFEHGNVRGGGGVSHSPRKSFHYQGGYRHPHHHSPQYHPRQRVPFKPIAHFHDSGNHRGPLTPPPTPLPVDGPPDSNLMTNTKQLAALKI